MRLNPELRRNLWLEFSAARLIGMPLTLGMLFFLSTGVGPSYHNHHTALISLAIGLYGLLVGLWGGRNAADTVISEVNEGTWDFQRLSSLSPFSLALGKLLGSTCYAWYGGLMVWLVYVVASAEDLSGYYLFCNAVLLLEAGLICHAAALFSSLQSMHGVRIGREKIRSGTHHALGVLTGLFFYTAISASPQTRALAYKAPARTPEVVWYGATYEFSGFALCFGLVLLAWLMAGIHAQMKAHLQVRSGPWLWISFVLFMMFYMAGFGDNPLVGDTASRVPLGVALMTGLFFFYSTAFMESWSGMSYRRVLEAAQKKQYARMLSLSPRWMVTLLIVLVTTALFIVGNIGEPMVWLYALAILCFSIRDVAILHYFRLAPNARRAMAATAFWLFMLYGLLPMLLNAMNLKGLAGLFLPMTEPRYGEIPAGLVASGIIQAGIVVVMTCRRWLRQWRIRA